LKSNENLLIGSSICIAIVVCAAIAKFIRTLL
jgi:hypothetical protein